FFLSEENIPSDCSIFDISDPLYPTLVDTIYNNGAIGIDEEDELLFMGRNICSIYDLSNIENNSINEIYSFQNWSYAQQTIPFMRNCNNYLLYLEDTSVNIYEYSTTSIDEELQQVNNIQFTNYPNPFSNSTTISFFNTKPSKNTKIKIYNIKGQLVKQLSIVNCKSSIDWDGKDENGKQVPSGIYLCKLSIGKEAIVRKMVLLR
ncbi:MAG: T9SS type A sorting domain-containing protein, partial [Candidatus Cloacimonetes bacterium]|nr:T9SS type A sorting domain-containing protein [Candidatus Cloacimonadota bacterium]